MSNRDMSFRVWEPLNRKMHYVKFALYKFDETSVNSHRFILPNGEQHVRDAYTIMNLNAVKVMQYTGLKDKNNKEIYEGDVVRVIESSDDGDKEFNGYVDFSNGSFIIKNSLGSHYRWLDYRVEVLGNMYENPEWIEG